jgi:ABC-2 type transport system permease protein
MNPVRDGHLGIAIAAARAEASAAWRRPGALAAIAALAAFPLLTYHHLFDGSLAKVVIQQTYYMNTFAPVAVGVIFADRFVRDRQLGVREVLDTLPTSAAARLWGRFAGVIAAGALPVLAVWLVQALHIALVTHRAAALGLAAASFSVGVLPGLVAVCGLCLAGPALLGLPLFRVLFVCYWFWGNLIPSQLFPSPSETWATPIGGISLSGIFHIDFGIGRAAAVDGIGSVTVLVIAGLVLVSALQFSERRRRATA